MSYGIISIKPNYMKMILSGDKIFEFRRRAPSKLPITFLLYATSPEKKIVGIAYVSSFIRKATHELWKTCADRGGIDEDVFKTYFEGVDTGIALVLDSVRQFDEPLDPHDLFEGFSPPQSFCYLEDEFLLPVELQGQIRK